MSLRLTEPTDSPKLTCLTSYAYIRELNDEQTAWLLDNQHPALRDTEWLLDSGAFTAKNTGAEITYDEYVEFLAKWRHRFVGYIALDVVGDAAGSWHNLERMWADGLTPIPVHTLHDTQDSLERMYEHSDWVALAGLRRPHRGLASKQFVARKHAMAKGRAAHWLGYTKHSMVNTLKPYSVDSASLNAAAMWGRCQLWMRPGKLSSSLSGKQCAEMARERHPVIMRLLDMLDLDPNWLENHDSHRRMVHRGLTAYHFALDRLNKLSWVMYSRDVRQHVGTRMFLACRANHFGWVFESWVRLTTGERWEAPKWQQA